MVNAITNIEMEIYNAEAILRELKELNACNGNRRSWKRNPVEDAASKKHCRKKKIGGRMDFEGMGASRDHVVTITRLRIGAQIHWQWIIFRRLAFLQYLFGGCGKYCKKGKCG